MILNKTGITVSQVASTLGTSSRDVGQLCTNSNINKWSKYKPVNLSTPTPSRSGDWWKGDNMRCGITVGLKDSAGAIRHITRLDDIPNGDWYYDFVTPANPKRLADFGGYNSEAMPVIYSGVDKDVVQINTAKGDYHPFYFEMIDTASEDNLSVNDFQFLNDYYFACAIKGSGTFGHWREYRGDKITAGNGAVNLPTANLDNGTYDCILFASTSSSPELAGDMIPLPHDAFHKTSFQIKIGRIFSFDIQLDYVGRSRTGSWTYIDDIPWYDDMTGKGGYKCPRGGTLYFKGRVVRVHEGYDSVNAVDLKGESESFHGGMNKNGLSGAITDLNGNVLNQLHTPGSTIGDYDEIIVKWSGYTGDREPTEEDQNVIGGGLSIYSKTAYLGGSSDFDLVW